MQFPCNHRSISTFLREAEPEGEGKGKQKLVSEEPPEEFLCPITQELMKDPVVASDGHTYEKYVLVFRPFLAVSFLLRADAVIACAGPQSKSGSRRRPFLR